MEEQKIDNIVARQKDEDAIIIGLGSWKYRFIEWVFIKLVSVFRISMLITLCFFSLNICSGQSTNILFVFIDDMGYGDLGCYGNPEVRTPHIDLLADEGIRFNQFYVNSPICSPSRTAVITGHYPSRWGITSYISSREQNKSRGIRDYLDLKAPSIGRSFQKAGYYTAHIGKWHLGGGRDVADVPLIEEYGFDESVTQFEGLGERYLATYETLNHLKDSTRGLEKMSADLGRGEVHWEKRENFTRVFVDRTIVAIENARRESKPFYINLWPDDIHTPLEPPASLRGDLSVKSRFLGVMEEMDRQMGRLFKYIRNEPDLANNTLIVFTSDNGPDKNVNKAGDLKGYKTQLYEGGIKEPFIVWWPGVISKDKRGTINKNSVIAGVDLPLTFMQVGSVDPPKGISYDGENMFDVISGESTRSRWKPLFWIRPPDRPGYDGDNDPDLAIRKGDFKLLMDVDGSNMQLYNISEDPGESSNLATTDPEIADELRQELLHWYVDYPHDIDKSIYKKGTK